MGVNMYQGIINLYKVHNILSIYIVTKALKYESDV